jgi:hypothetical protein
MGRREKNIKTLKKGFALFDKAIEDYVIDTLTNSGELLLAAVARNRTYTGFTGNTQTSYACGIYAHGVLKNVVYQQNWSAPPVRMKVQKNQFVFLSRPYEGNPRGVRGAVDVDNNFGLATSLEFLRQYKGSVKNGWGFVITTGTEYSEFLETVYHMDVLTNTADEASYIILSNMRPMGSEWQ